jgi:sugar phosphate isomerase/epimerase
MQSREHLAELRIGVVAEAFADLPLAEVIDWLAHTVPEISELEIGTGGYAPVSHCDLRGLLTDANRRRAWHHEIETRGMRIGALNAWGNPLHPDAELARRHDADLRDTIRLAAELGVDRVVALAGCPGAGPEDTATPHFAAGGWLPYLDGIWERQWQDVVAPYWTDLATFAAREHSTLLICLELHPGTAVYNVDTFSRLAQLGANLAANLDPSHFFWQSMDALAIVKQLGPRIGYVHAKDVRFIEKNLALNGVLDRRWPNPPDQMPWNFATVGQGQGHDPAWWRTFVSAIATQTRARTLSIEHEDPFVPPIDGVPAAANVLAAALRELKAQAAAAA